MADEKHEHGHAHAEHHAAHGHDGKKKEEVSIYLVAGFAGLFLLLMVFNQMQMGDVYSALAKGGLAASSAGGAVASGAAAGATGGAAVASTGDVTQDAINIIISTGTPAVYGAELGISFDDPVNGYKVLGNLDRTINYNTMSAEEQKRYMAVGTRAACQYCCGAKTLVLGNGQAACACEHSYAMRGLAKYLITKHGKEYSDYELLTEVNKWKAIFFPKQTVARAIAYYEKNGKFVPDEIWNSMSS